MAPKAKTRLRDRPPPADAPFAVRTAWHQAIFMIDALRESARALARGDASSASSVEGAFLGFYARDLETMKWMMLVHLFVAGSEMREDAQRKGLPEGVIVPNMHGEHVIAGVRHDVHPFDAAQFVADYVFMHWYTSRFVDQIDARARKRIEQAKPLFRDVALGMRAGKIPWKDMYTLMRAIGLAPPLPKSLKEQWSRAQKQMRAARG